MRITNEKELAMVRKTFSQFSGSAVVIDSRNGRRYDLHDADQREQTLRALMTDYHENLELYVSKREDMGLAMELMERLAGEADHRQDEMAA